MLPRCSMLTIKKLFGKSFIFLTLAALLTGCLPPEQRALLDGKQLLDKGRFSEAIEELKVATSLMNTNAQAWNYLGLAYHQTGQATNAADAYLKALKFDQNLDEAHYNLGCLWLDQNRPDLAKTELTAFTLRRANSADGLVKLGTAHLRIARSTNGAAVARELTASEKSFNEALRLEGQNLEALNGLGLVQQQRQRPREAAQFFNTALKHQPDYPPALLNLAIVSHLHLNDRQTALQRYREYLGLKPQPPDWNTVSATVRSLEQELGVSTRPAPPPPAAQNIAVTNLPKPATNVVARAPAPAPTPPAVTTPRPAAHAPPNTQNVQAVRLPPEPVVRPAHDVSPAPTPSTPVPSTQAVASASGNRSFLQRMNPKNLFNGETSAPPPTAAAPAVSGADPAGTTPKFARYTYRTMPKPVPGDPAAAERAFAKGVQAQRANELFDAIQAYRQATQLDPAYYDAYYNLGLAATQTGNLQPALTAYESALAIRPESLDGRYNFALVLKQANYPVDAVLELEKILRTYPNDARVHLALGNLYAQVLRQPVKAREHYSKVLEINPENPQAGAIHDWLWSNRR